MEIEGKIGYEVGVTSIDEKMRERVALDGLVICEGWRRAINAPMRKEWFFIFIFILFFKNWERVIWFKLREQKYVEVYVK